jgi:hypothetical protein
VEKQHFFSEHDDAEFEKEVFLHIGLVLTQKNVLKNEKNRFFKKNYFCIFFIFKNVFLPK